MRIITFLLLCNFSLLQSQNLDIELELLASGFDNPVEIKNAGDSRLFIVQQTGLIRILNADGSINEEPFLDLTTIITDQGSEQGLLGLAFHPDYTNNGQFFVNYTETINGDDATTIARFTVSDNQNIADPNSLTKLITIPQPFANHNGGCLQFGPDGYLYISSGDGGSGGDPGNRSQDLSTLLGKLLRIDVDNPDNGLNYGIPDDNPFVGNPDALDEIWSYGLRNPWKFSFDSENDDLWIGDVGQGEVEEINRATAASPGGENYGWRCYEGSEAFNSSNCPSDDTLTFPIAEYTHSGNGLFKCSITGGYVYRGSEFPNMVGTYVFADFCSSEVAILDNTNTISYFGPFDGGITSLGEDSNNELYAAIPATGSIYKVIDNSVLSTEDFNVSELNIYYNTTTSSIDVIFPAFAKAEQLNLYDISGKLVHTELIESSETSFEVAKLSSGVYIATMSTSPQIIKLIVH